MDWFAIAVGAWAGATLGALLFWPESLVDFWRNARRYWS